MRKALALGLLLLAVLPLFAQKTFNGITSFRYDIEYSSQHGDSLLTGAYLMVSPVDKSPFSQYTIHISPEEELKGRVLDIQIYADRREFLLENYFAEKQHARMVLAQLQNDANERVAFLYRDGKSSQAGQECHCFVLQ